MTEPYTAADVQLVARALGADYWTDDERAEAARAILSALAEAGRLVPDGAERTEEWTMRYRVNGGRLQIAEEGGHVLDSREYAALHIEAWRRHYPDLTYTDVTYLHRDVLTGPWVEADEASNQEGKP